MKSQRITFMHFWKFKNIIAIAICEQPFMFSCETALKKGVINSMNNFHLAVMREFHRIPCKFKQSVVQLIYRTINQRKFSSILPWIAEIGNSQFDAFEGL